MKSLSQIEELVASKDVVKVKNGVIQIDPSHPDYDFWMEDWLIYESKRNIQT